VASGMLGAAQDYDIGGMQLPYTVNASANAFFALASVSIGSNLLTVGNANLLLVHGTDMQKRVFAANEFSGRWAGTMCLSEPQAGSSLSDITTRAEPDGEGAQDDPLGPRYRLRGNKMWISSGDHELTENIVHLVLAKIAGPDGRLIPGTRGISLFIVPKKLVDTEGRLTGVRNDVELALYAERAGQAGTLEWQPYTGWETHGRFAPATSARQRQARRLQCPCIFQPRCTMSDAHDAYDADRPLMLRCACGQDHAPGEHGQAPASAQALSAGFMEAALVKALFPVDSVRRGFLRAVGANTARAAIASLLPLQALEAMAQEKRPLEKKDLKIGFIAITCATPLIMADPLGFYKKEGLNVQLNKTAGWALIRAKMINKEHDASHFLSPMPLAMSMGLGSNPVAMNVATIQNTNGQAITLHVKHKDKRDPKSWKGFKFAVPFEYSMHNFLLRYFLAEHGINPDTDVQLRVIAPPEMVANLRAGNIDGF
ncbi:MAG: ABC transporter substrate-binding protein, partial [Rubrivivax sp.]|nr:ABC transporter substrate-binding protein [Rubrivivax sp.]